MHPTRREAIGALALAAIPAPSPAAEIDPAVVRRHDDDVARLLERQVTDPASRGYGTQRDDLEMFSPGAAAGLLESYYAAFLCPQSKYHRDAALVERMKLAARFLERAQDEHGFVDLATTNFSSPPDTGFTVHPAATAACLAMRQNERELVALMEPFLRKAANGLATGGVHTPNHRWVVCQALAQVNEVFPNPAYVRRIDQWLTEGIDLDADGQFTERSTSVYNAVSDRAFLVMALKLKRPELLEPVRRNLNAMLYLLHPGLEVVTEISRRQDRNQRATMSSYWLPLRYLAVRDADGRLATLAEHYSEASRLSAFLEYPEMSGPMAALSPLPEDFERELNTLGAARFRRGSISATLLEGDSVFFTLRRGNAVVNAVRFASAFFGKGQFVPSKLQKEGSAYVLRQELEAPYYQPLPRRVAADQWDQVRGQRQRSEVCRLRQSASITEIPGGFRLRLEAQGTPHVPVAVEVSLRSGDTPSGCVPAPGNPEGMLLPSGYATYTVGPDQVKFGPGRGEHRYTQVRGAEPKLPGISVYLTGFTPFDHVLEFQ
ncbi:MAG: hypothetical protein LAQ69_13155 [Acidobacteriia bacterium]|nr:hypothetical protein [Terriglobia bacterium]